MKFTAIIALSATAALVSAVPRLYRREVPQEHAHDAITLFMTKNCFQLNTNGLSDPVFGLLGQAKANENAPNGNGQCLQQLIADQSVTNAKAKLTGQAKTDCISASIKYRALERNANGVGVATPNCPTAPTNPELIGIIQHQDAASTNAAAINLQSELAVAKALSAIGVDPLQAAQTAAFAPGNTSDNTGKGNSCDTQDCFNTAGHQLQPAATNAQLLAAAAAGGSNSTTPASTPPSSTASAPSSTNPASGSTGSQCSVVFVTVSV